MSTNGTPRAGEAQLDHQSNSGPLVKPTNKFQVGSLSFEATGDRLLIQEDEFRTGYECSNCGGAGKMKHGECLGTGTKPSGKKCSECDGKGVITCEVCGGKGGLIIAPDVAQRRPTSGIIVSIGEDVKSFKVGDSVLYSNFSGYVVDLERAGQPVTLRILHDTEILCRMDGHLTLANLRGKSEVAVFNN